MVYLVVSRKKKKRKSNEVLIIQHKSRWFFHHTSPVSDRSFRAAVLFYKSGTDAGSVCEEPALIMHEPRLPGENTTRAGERGGERSTAGSTKSQIHTDSRTGLIFWRKRAERIAAPSATWREFRVVLWGSQTPFYDEIVSRGSDTSEGLCFGWMWQLSNYLMSFSLFSTSYLRFLCTHFGCSFYILIYALGHLEPWPHVMLSNKNIAEIADLS